MKKEFSWRFIRSFTATVLFYIGVKPSLSTFIDDDTIIMGYGQLHYDFYYPLPDWIVKKKYGTLSWNEFLYKK